MQKKNQYAHKSIEQREYYIIQIHTRSGIRLLGLISFCALHERKKGGGYRTGNTNSLEFEILKL